MKTSCFIAGTQVAVEGGSVAIESLTEGTRVITRVDPAEYGVASDEDVAVTLSETVLCGFSKSREMSMSSFIATNARNSLRRQIMRHLSLLPVTSSILPRVYALSIPTLLARTILGWTWAGWLREMWSITSPQTTRHTSISKLNPSRRTKFIRQRCTGFTCVKARGATTPTDT